MLPSLVAAMLRDLAGPSEVALPMLGMPAKSPQALANMYIDMYSDIFYSACQAVSHLNFSRLGWGASELRRLGRFLRYCPRAHTLELAGNPLGEEGGQLVAEMLCQPSCPVTKVDLRDTGVGAGAVRQLMSSGRIRAVELNELPLYSVREVEHLGATRGVFHGQARLVLDKQAARRRVAAVEPEEGARRSKEWQARKSHRYGWPDGWEDWKGREEWEQGPAGEMYEC